MAVEFNSIEAETSVGSIDDLCKYDSAIVPEVKDKWELAQLIFFLPEEESLVLVLRYLGYTSKEIVKILKLENPRDYYGITNSIKTHTYLFKNLRKGKNN